MTTQRNLSHPPSRRRGEPMSMGRLGLYLFLGSYAIVFATLIVIVIYLHHLSSEWPPAGVRPLSVTLGLSVTAVLLFSSLVVFLANRAARRGKYTRFAGWMYLGIGLGLLFLAGQIYQFVTAGITIRSGAYGTTFFTLAGFHAFHIVVGLFLLVRMLDRAHVPPAKAEKSPETPAAVIVWHFLDLMWIPMFLVLYLG